MTVIIVGPRPGYFKGIFRTARPLPSHSFSSFPLQRDGARCQTHCSTLQALKTRLVTPLVPCKIVLLASIVGIPHRPFPFANSLLSITSHQRPFTRPATLWSVTRRSTTTSHIFSGTSTGCGFRKEYNYDWPYSFSAAVTSWLLHTSSAIFNGLTKPSRCDDYDPAFKSA